MRRRKIEAFTGDMDKPSELSVDMSQETTAADLLVSHDTVSEGRRSAQLDELAFMEEPIEFMIHETTDNNAEPRVEVGVNGEMRLFVRGIKYRERRKFVEAIARAKQTAVSTPEVTGADGERRTQTKKRTSDHYPLSVFNDTPKGMAWLRGIQANG